MRPRNFVLLLICALLTFGGSFTCTSGNDHGDTVIVTDHPSPHGQ